MPLWIKDHKISVGYESNCVCKHLGQGENKVLLDEIIMWYDIKATLPKNLKVSPILMVPHKSREFCAISNFSFWIMISGFDIPLFNDNAAETAPD